MTLDSVFCGTRQRFLSTETRHPSTEETHRPDVQHLDGEDRRLLRHAKGPAGNGARDVRAVAVVVVRGPEAIGREDLVRAALELLVRRHDARVEDVGVGAFAGGLVVFVCALAERAVGQGGEAPGRVFLNDGGGLADDVVGLDEDDLPTDLLESSFRMGRVPITSSWPRIFSMVASSKVPEYPLILKSQTWSTPSN